MPLQRLKRRAPLVLLPLALLTGCVAVDVKEGPITSVTNPTVSNKPVPYDTAMDYLQTTRKAYLDRAKAFEGVDAATRLGVGVAVAGAGVSATLKKDAAKKAGKFLTFGAVSFITNQNLAPVAISRVYRAGATNLECIRAAAIIADIDAGQMGRELDAHPERITRLESAINALQATVDTIQTQTLSATPDESIDDLLSPADNALVAIKNARKVLRGVAIFQTTDGVGERVLAAVNGTRQVVNDLALERTPDVEAILQSGSAFARFMTTGGTWVGDIKAAKDSVNAAFASAGATESASLTEKGVTLRDQLKARELDLRAALAAIPDLSLENDFAAIAQCQTAVGVYKPVTVSPSPIKATIGGDPVKVTVTGKSPFVGRNLPNHVTFDGSGKSPTLKAGAKAEAGDHTIQITDALGVNSGDLVLTLEAKAADSAKPPPADTANNGAVAPGKETAPANPPAVANTVPAPANPTVKKDDAAKKDGKTDGSAG